MSGNESTKEFKIISLLPYIKSNPIIYDKKRKDFKDIEKKEDVWRKIAFELGTSVEECQRYWKSTRERYSRERKFCRMNSKYSEWPLYGDMSFLAKHILPRNAKRGHVNNPQNISRQPTEFIVLPTSSSSPRSAICDNNNSSSSSTMDVYLHDNNNSDNLDDNDIDDLHFDPPKTTINQHSPPPTLHLLEPITPLQLSPPPTSQMSPQCDNNDDSSASDSSYEYVTTSETQQQHPTQLEGQRHLKDKRSSVVRNSAAGGKRTRIQRQGTDDGGDAATVEKTLEALSRYLLAKDDVNMAFGRYVARALQELPQDVQKSKMLAIVKILTD